MNNAHRWLLPALAVAGTLLIGAAPAQAASTCAPPLTWLQQRVLAKHAQGIDALRRYVWITRSIHQLDMTETVDWINERHAAEARCVQAAAKKKTPLA